MLFVFAILDHVVSSKSLVVVEQRQAEVTAYLESKQLPLCVFARWSVCQYSMAEENPATQRQTAVTAYMESKQLLLLAFPCGSYVVIQLTRG